MRIVQATVYQPAVPLRAVVLNLDLKTGEVSVFDTAVLGVQVEALQFDEDNNEDSVEVRHEPVIWNDLHGGISTVGEMCRAYPRTLRVVVGPVTHGADWFDAEVARTRAGLEHYRDKHKGPRGPRAPVEFENQPPMFPLPRSA